MADVTSVVPGFWTPRIVMHRCSASITTATPSGESPSMMASAIWPVSRSCSCGRRARISTARAILLAPAVGRLAEPLAGLVFADGFEDLAHGAGDALLVHSLNGRCHHSVLTSTVLPGLCGGDGTILTAGNPAPPPRVWAAGEHGWASTRGERPRRGICLADYGFTTGLPCPQGD